MFNWDFTGLWSMFNKPVKAATRKPRKDGEIDTDVSESSEGEVLAMIGDDWEDTRSFFTNITKDINDVR